MPNTNTLTPTTPCSVEFRKLDAGDLAEVLAIERASYQPAWTSGQFYSHKPPVDRYICVAIHEGVLTGYLAMSKRPNFLQIERLAVAPQFRRLRIGANIVTALKACLNPRGPSWIQTEVRETNLAAQLFLRSCGFVATAYLPEAVIDIDEHEAPVIDGAIVFRYRYEKPISIRIAE